MSVVVALLLVVLLGFGAIAVDVGMLYSERTQLRNASDAAALMVAQKCARNLADPNCAATAPLASELANKNAVDGLSNVKSIELDKANRTVRVTAGAKESGKAANEVSLFFARVLGLETAEVTASLPRPMGHSVQGPPDTSPRNSPVQTKSPPRCGGRQRAGPRLRFRRLRRDPRWIQLD